MQRIRVSVVRSGFGSTDGFQVYGAGADGVIDWAHPVTPRSQLFWADAEPFPGSLMGAHLTRGHLEAVRSDGHLEGAHLLDCALRPASTVTCVIRLVVFGRFRYALATQDAAGNRGEAIQFEAVVNSEPAGTSRLLPAAHLPSTGRMKLTFVPSARLTG